MTNTFKPEHLHFKLITLPDGNKVNILRSSLKDCEGNYLYDGDVIHLTFFYEDGERIRSSYYLRYMQGKGFTLIPNNRESGEVLYEFEMTYVEDRACYISSGKYYNLSICNITKEGNGYVDPKLIYCPF